MNGLLIARHELGAALQRDMLALHSRYFEGADAAQFERDLAEKNWVVVIRAEGGALAGFSTLRVEPLHWKGEPITLVSSGDTVTAPEVWNSPVLSRTWIDAVRRIHAHEPQRRLLWLLLVSGYRTYRFLPVYWREFFPRFDRQTPPAVRELMHGLAQRRYGSCFDARAGIVRFPRPGVLRDELRRVPETRKHDPDVAYFLAANPGHERGEELVCLTELAEWNLTPAGRRMTRAPGSAER